MLWFCVWQRGHDGQFRTTWFTGELSETLIRLSIWYQILCRVSAQVWRYTYFYIHILFIHTASYFIFQRMAVWMTWSQAMLYHRGSQIQRFLSAEALLSAQVRHLLFFIKICLFNSLVLLIIISMSLPSHTWIVADTVTKHCGITAYG